jgi:DNA-binding transcriptional ArsR family regulator
MPPLENDLLLSPQQATIIFGLEPAHNALYSLLLINRDEQLSGLGEWVTRMAAKLASEQRHTNRLALEGLYFAVEPDRSWPSFPAYIDHLAAQPAAALRDRLLHRITRSSGLSSHEGGLESWPTPAAILASVEVYLNHLVSYFPGVEIDVAIETETHALLNDPPRMQELVVSHFRAMWRDGLADEWERVRPMLHESVSAFQQLDLSGLSTFEAARTITGQDFQGKWERILADARKIVFVPSAHIGPYLGKFGGEKIAWVVFGARLPAGAHSGSSALSRSDLLVRLSALTDDTRLLILALLSQHDELCAQDIIARLDLSQSAASRHLRQLSATGYLIERRREGAKCYTLNRDRIDETFRALSQFLTRP